MNIQQLEYIIAIDKHRHFVKAAESCFVTQATLSMMIRKLEEEIGIVIFDRSRQPVEPTDAGKKIIEQARCIIRETKRLSEIASGEKNDLSGELRIGIIPTLAPYLLPLFLNPLLKKYPALHLFVHEITTTEITERLTHDQLDIGILATPLHDQRLSEYPLFTERLLAYVPGDKHLLRKKYLVSADLDPGKLLLLEEGHCLRSQMLNLCALRRSADPGNLHYEAGSIESVLRMAEINQRITIVPELATIDFGKKKKSMLREFRSPQPAREISLVTSKYFVKKAVLEILSKTILKAVEPLLQQKQKEQKIIPAG